MCHCHLPFIPASSPHLKNSAGNIEAFNDRIAVGIPLSTIFIIRLNTFHLNFFFLSLSHFGSKIQTLVCFIRLHLLKCFLSHLYLLSLTDILLRIWVFLALSPRRVICLKYATAEWKRPPKTFLSLSLLRDPFVFSFLSFSVKEAKEFWKCCGNNATLNKKCFDEGEEQFWLFSMLGTIHQFEFRIKM